MTSHSKVHDTPLHWSRRTCPECNGTGYVFVADEFDTRPLKDRGPDWGEPRKMHCGFCGGDGVVSPGFYDDFAEDIRHPIDLYTERKKRALT